MKSVLTYIIVLLICLISRLITAVNHIEDSESLDFVFGLYNYDPASGASSFPGNPLFYFILIIIKFFAGTPANTFALIGGFSTFLIILYTSRILRVPLISLEGGLTGLLIFFNANLWLTSNKFLPDILALSLALPVFYYFLVDNFRPKYVYTGWFIAGLVPGIMFSYIPLILLPCIYVLYKRRKFPYGPLIFIGSILAWALPLFFILGSNSFLLFVQNHTSSILDSLSNFSFARLLSIPGAIWAEGLGGFVPGRTLFSILNSLGIVTFLFFGFMIVTTFGHTKIKVIIGASTLILSVLISFIFRDTYNVHRLILPLAPFFMIFICYGIIYFLVNINKLYIKLSVLLFIIAYLVTNINLISKQKEPTAIVQVKNHLIQNGLTNSHIVSTPEVISYLTRSGISAQFYNPENLINLAKDNNNYIIIDPEKIISSKVTNKKEPLTFNHEKLVNRQWSQIKLYITKNAENTSY